MAKESTNRTVLYDSPETGEMTLTITANHHEGTIALSLDLEISTEIIVAIYQIRNEEDSIDESWNHFQEPNEAAGLKSNINSPLVANESLNAGGYFVDVRVTDGLETYQFPVTPIQLDNTDRNGAKDASYKSFKNDFDKIFEKFLHRKITTEQCQSFLEALSSEQLDYLFQAIIELGGPQNYTDDYPDDFDMSGFFDFVDYLTAVLFTFGESAKTKLQAIPDSPTNQHYIHFIKQYLSDKRFYDPILDKYPYCR